jgi:putative toxin-antitoxin system antitoxin component (TIGR02293 family)
MAFRQTKRTGGLKVRSLVGRFAAPPPADARPSRRNNESYKAIMSRLGAIQDEMDRLFPDTAQNSAVESVRHLHRDRMLSLAAEVWGNAEEAQLWLDTPHPELRGAKPSSLLGTSQGRSRVENLLHALDEGFPV